MTHPSHRLIWPMFHAYAAADPEVELQVARFILVDYGNKSQVVAACVKLPILADDLRIGHFSFPLLAITHGPVLHIRLVCQFCMFIM